MVKLTEEIGEVKLTYEADTVQELINLKNAINQEPAKVAQISKSLIERLRLVTNQKRKISVALRNGEIMEGFVYEFRLTEYMNVPGQSGYLSMISEEGKISSKIDINFIEKLTL
jgi:predicted DNA-binding protein (UPF0251 family)